MRPTFQKLIAGGISLIFFSQTALGSLAETSFWKDRQEALKRNEKRKETPLRLAGLPNFPDALNSTRVLNQMPLPQLQSLQRPVAMSSFDNILPPGAPSKLRSLVASIPLSFGSIRKISIPQNKPTDRVVIHIQDVHMNLEAQKNIGNAIRAMIGGRQVDFVGLEGAFNPIDLRRFREFPHHDVIGMVSDYLLRENRISGPIHTALTTTDALPPFAGIDDAAHYRANVEAYRKAATEVGVQKKLLLSRQRGLAEEKGKFFNPALMELDQKVEAQRRGELPLGEYLQTLKRAVKELPASCEKFLEALKMENDLNFPQVEAERSRILSLLTEKLNKNQISELLNASLAYRLGSIQNAAFYQYVDGLCEKNGIHLSRFPAMRNYLQYILLAENIDVEVLLKEVRLAEEKAYASLVRSPEEKELIAKSRRLYLVGKLLDFALTTSEWEEYKKAVPRPSSLVPRENSSNFRDEGQGTRDVFSLSVFESFYHEAEIRDAAMTENLLRDMKNAKAKVAVLVTGGFHSSGIDRKMTDAGVATITFAPKITKVESENGTNYLSVFTQERTPLEKLFQGDKLFLAFPPAIGAEVDHPPIDAAMLPHEAQKTIDALAPGSVLKAEEASTPGNPKAVIVTNSRTGFREKISIEATAERIVKVTCKGLEIPFKSLIMTAGVWEELHFLEIGMTWPQIGGMFLLCFSIFLFMRTNRGWQWPIAIRVIQMATPLGPSIPFLNWEWIGMLRKPMSMAGSPHDAQTRGIDGEREPKEIQQEKQLSGEQEGFLVAAFKAYFFGFTKRDDLRRSIQGASTLNEIKARIDEIIKASGRPNDWNELREFQALLQDIGRAVLKSDWAGVGGNLISFFNYLIELFRDLAGQWSWEIIDGPRIEIIDEYVQECHDYFDYYIRHLRYGIRSSLSDVLSFLQKSFAFPAHPSQNPFTHLAAFFQATVSMSMEQAYQRAMAAIIEQRIGKLKREGVQSIGALAEHMGEKGEQGSRARDAIRSILKPLIPNRVLSRKIIDRIVNSYGIEDSLNIFSESVVQFLRTLKKANLPLEFAVCRTLPMVVLVYKEGGSDSEYAIRGLLDLGRELAEQKVGPCAMMEIAALHLIQYHGDPTDHALATLKAAEITWQTRTGSWRWHDAKEEYSAHRLFYEGIVFPAVDEIVNQVESGAVSSAQESLAKIDSLLNSLFTESKGREGLQVIQKLAEKMKSPRQRTMLFVAKKKVKSGAAQAASTRLLWKTFTPKWIKNRPLPETLFTVLWECVRLAGPMVALVFYYSHHPQMALGIIFLLQLFNFAVFLGLEHNWVRNNRSFLILMTIAYLTIPCLSFNKSFYFLLLLIPVLAVHFRVDYPVIKLRKRNQRIRFIDQQFPANVVDSGHRVFSDMDQTFLFHPPGLIFEALQGLLIGNNKPTVKMATKSAIDVEDLNKKAAQKLKEIVQDAYGKYRETKVQLGEKRIKAKDAEAALGRFIRLIMGGYFITFNYLGQDVKYLIPKLENQNWVELLKEVKLKGSFLFSLDQYKKRNGWSRNEIVTVVLVTRSPLEKAMAFLDRPDIKNSLGNLGIRVGILAVEIRPTGEGIDDFEVLQAPAVKDEVHVFPRSFGEVIFGDNAESKEFGRYGNRFINVEQLEVEQEGPMVGYWREKFMEAPQLKSTVILPAEERAVIEGKRKGLSQGLTPDPVPGEHRRDPASGTSAQPKSIPLTIAAALVWGLITLGIYHAGTMWAILPGIWAVLSFIDAGLIYCGYQRQGSYDLIETFRVRGPPENREAMPSSRRWNVAENIKGVISNANASILTGLPFSIQKYYLDREQLFLQKWGAWADVVSHLIFDQVVLAISVIPHFIREYICWPVMRQIILRMPTSNFHRHISASVPIEFIARMFRENQAARAELKEKYGATFGPQFDPGNPADLRRFMRMAISSGESADFHGMAFEPRRIYRKHDPEFKIDSLNARQIVRDSAREGNRMVGIRAGLASDDTPEVFSKRIEAVVQEMIRAEEAEGHRIQAKLILGLKKGITASQAQKTIEVWLDLKKEWERSRPEFAEKLYGVDTADAEEDYDPRVHEPAMRKARDQGQVVLSHMGEFWRPGELLKALKRVEQMIDSGVVSIVTNPTCLFVDSRTLNENLYPADAKEAVRKAQAALWRKFSDQGVAIEISPSSNDWLTRKVRRLEGWRLSSLSSKLNQGVRICVTDDDATIFDTSFLNELKKLYLGQTPYGRVGLVNIFKLAFMTAIPPYHPGSETPSISAVAFTGNLSWLKNLPARIGLGLAILTQEITHIISVLPGLIWGVRFGKFKGYSPWTEVAIRYNHAPPLVRAFIRLSGPLANLAIGLSGLTTYFFIGFPSFNIHFFFSWATLIHYFFISNLLLAISDLAVLPLMSLRLRQRSDVWKTIQDIRGFFNPVVPGQHSRSKWNLSFGLAIVMAILTFGVSPLISQDQIRKASPPESGQRVEETAPDQGAGEARKKLNELLDPNGPEFMIAAQKLTEQAYAIPAELWVKAPSVPNKPIESLKGFRVVTDGNTTIEAVILQAGNLMGIQMIGEIAAALRDEVRIFVTVDSQHHAWIVWKDLQSRNIKDISARLRFVLAPGKLSPWGRDPFIVLVNPQTHQYTLFPAKGNAGTQLDRSIGRKLLASGLGWDPFVNNTLNVSTLDMQGGDVTADATYVYIGNETIHYSRYTLGNDLVLTEEQAIKKIEEVTGKQAIKLDGPGDVHNDRYHMPIGGTKYGRHTSLLADPIMALEKIARMSPEEKEQAVQRIMEALEFKVYQEEITLDNVRRFLDVTPAEIQAARESKEVLGLEKTGRALEAKGIAVIRIPTLPIHFAQNPFGLYYTNVIMDDHEDSKGFKDKSVIVPRYLIPQLDDAVVAVFKDLGFHTVKQVTSVVAGIGEGGPRCCVQVLGHPFQSHKSPSPAFTGKCAWLFVPGASGLTAPAFLMRISAVLGLGIAALFEGGVYGGVFQFGGWALPILAVGVNAVLHILTGVYRLDPTNPKVWNIVKLFDRSKPSGQKWNLSWDFWRAQLKANLTAATSLIAPFALSSIPTIHLFLNGLLGPYFFSALLIFLAVWPHAFINIYRVLSRSKGTRTYRTIVRSSLVSTGLSFVAGFLPILVILARTMPAGLLASMIIALGLFLSWVAAHIKWPIDRSTLEGKKAFTLLKKVVWSSTGLEAFGILMIASSLLTGSAVGFFIDAESVTWSGNVLPIMSSLLFGLSLYHAHLMRLSLIKNHRPRGEPLVSSSVAKRIFTAFLTRLFISSFYLLPTIPASSLTLTWFFILIAVRIHAAYVARQLRRQISPEKIRAPEVASQPGITSRGFSRRWLFKVAVKASIVIGTLTSVIGGVLYEFATDHSVRWLSRPLPPIGPIARRRPVWEPYEDWVTQLRKLWVDPDHPETTRKAALALRFEINRWFGNEKVNKPSHLTLDQLLLIRSRIGALNPNLFSNFAVQWEVLRLRLDLARIVAQVYENTEEMNPQEVAVISRIFQDLFTARNPSNSGDSYVRKAQWALVSELEPGQVLNAVHYYELGKMARPLAKSKVHQALGGELRKILREADLAEDLSQPGLEDFAGAMDTRGERFPTQEAFEEAVDFYKTLKHGPERIIDFTDIEAVRLVRKKMRALAPFFNESGRAHSVPPDILAAVAAANLLKKANHPMYGVKDGWETTLRDAKSDLGGWKKAILKWGLDHLPKRIGRIQLIDKVGDFLAGLLGSASPTIGTNQIRAGETTTQPREFNVRRDHLWARWGVDASDWPNRKINWYLLDPRWNIEAAATLYEKMMQVAVEDQSDKALDGFPDVKRLLQTGWLNERWDPLHSFRGPDAVLGMFLSSNREGYYSPGHGPHTSQFMVNAAFDPVSEFIPYAHIVVLEAGLFDEIPAKIIGVSRPEQWEDLLKLTSDPDEYLRKAAIRSIRELAEYPAYRTSPLHSPALAWWRGYSLTHGSSLSVVRGKGTNSGGSNETPSVTATIFTGERAWLKNLPVRILGIFAIPCQEVAHILSVLPGLLFGVRYGKFKGYSPWTEVAIRYNHAPPLVRAFIRLSGPLANLAIGLSGLTTYFFFGFPSFNIHFFFSWATLIHYFFISNLFLAVFDLIFLPLVSSRLRRESDLWSAAQDIRHSFPRLFQKTQATFLAFRKSGHSVKISFQQGCHLAWVTLKTLWRWKFSLGGAALTSFLIYLYLVSNSGRSLGANITTFGPFLFHALILGLLLISREFIMTPSYQTENYPKALRRAQKSLMAITSAFLIAALLQIPLLIGPFIMFSIFAVGLPLASFFILTHGSEGIHSRKKARAILWKCMAGISFFFFIMDPDFRFVLLPLAFIALHYQMVIKDFRAYEKWRGIRWAINGLLQFIIVAVIMASVTVTSFLFVFSQPSSVVSFVPETGQEKWHLVAFNQDRWKYPYEDMKTITRVRRVGTPTREERVHETPDVHEKTWYYRQLQFGPIRPIAIENVEAVREARAILFSLKPFIEESSRAHRVPPQVVATFLLLNRMVLSKTGTYDLREGWDHLVWYLNPRRHQEDIMSFLEDRKARDSMGRKYLESSHPVEFWIRDRLKSVPLQDRGADILGGLLLGLNPTTGDMQIRASQVEDDALRHETNIRDHHLLSRLGIEVSKLSNRQLNWMLLTDPRISMEAGAASLRVTMNRLIEAQQKGLIASSPAFPDLNLLDQAPGWLYYGAPDGFSPDVLMETITTNEMLPNKNAMLRWEYNQYPNNKPTLYNFVNAVMMANVRAYNPHQFQVIAWEAGVLDEIPGIIVGIDTPEKVDYVFSLAEGEDPYVQAAAERSLLELQNDSNPDISQKAKLYLQQLGKRGHSEDETPSITATAFTGNRAWLKNLPARIGLGLAIPVQEFIHILSALSGLFFGVRFGKFKWYTPWTAVAIRYNHAPPLVLAFNRLSGPLANLAIGLAALTHYFFIGFPAFNIQFFFSWATLIHYFFISNLVLAVSDLAVLPLISQRLRQKSDVWKAWQDIKAFFNPTHPAKELARIYAKGIRRFAAGAVSSEEIETILGPLISDRLRDLNSEGIGLAGFQPVQMEEFLKALDEELKGVKLDSNVTWSDLMDFVWNLSFYGVYNPDRDALVFVGESSEDEVQRIIRLRNRMSKNRRVFVIAREPTYYQEEFALKSQKGITVLKQGSSIIDDNNEINLVALRQILAVVPLLMARAGTQGQRGNLVALTTGKAALPSNYDPLNEKAVRSFMAELEQIGLEWAPLSSWMSGLPPMNPLGVGNVWRTALLIWRSA